MPPRRLPAPTAMKAPAAGSRRRSERRVHCRSEVARFRPRASRRPRHGSQVSPRKNRFSWWRSSAPEEGGEGCSSYSVLVAGPSACLASRQPSFVRTAATRLSGKSCRSDDGSRSFSFRSFLTNPSTSRCVPCAPAASRSTPSRSRASRQEAAALQTAGVKRPGPRQPRDQRSPRCSCHRGQGRIRRLMEARRSSPDVQIGTYATPAACSADLAIGEIERKGEGSVERGPSRLRQILLSLPFVLQRRRVPKPVSPESRAYCSR